MRSSIRNNGNHRRKQGPLRKVVGLVYKQIGTSGPDFRFEKLECGHEVLPPVSDWGGFYEAKARRCAYCLAEQTEDK